MAYPINRRICIVELSPGTRGGEKGARNSVGPMDEYIREKKEGKKQGQGEGCAFGAKEFVDLKHFERKRKNIFFFPPGNPSSKLRSAV